jgi:hypothetical protein
MSFIYLHDLNIFVYIAVISFRLCLLLSSSKISSFLLWYDKLYHAVRLMNFISAVFNLVTSLCFSVQISQPYKSDRIAKLTRVYPKVSGLSR